MQHRSVGEDARCGNSNSIRRLSGVVLRDVASNAHKVLE